MSRFGPNGICKNLQLKAVSHEEYEDHIRHVHLFSDGMLILRYKNNPSRHIGSSTWDVLEWGSTAI
jgi:hypothetical protein